MTDKKSNASDESWFWLNVRNAYDLWLVQVVQADEKARRRGRSR